MAFNTEEERGDGLESMEETGSASGAELVREDVWELGVDFGEKSDGSSWEAKTGRPIERGEGSCTEGGTESGPREEVGLKEEEEL